jgi:hypothetical protein
MFVNVNEIIYFLAASSFVSASKNVCFMFNFILFFWHSQMLIEHLVNVPGS